MKRKSKSQLKKDSGKLKPAVIIGKNLLTPTVIEEVIGHLKREKLVKVKFLQSARLGADFEGLILELAEKTQAEVVDIKGGTVVLYRLGDSKYTK